jgi:hypothetical protein
MTPTDHGAWRRLLAVAVATLAVALAMPAGAGALPPPYSNFDYNEPFAQQTGPETFVFDWSANKCEDNDIPDEAVRAFRSDTGQVQLMTSHFTNYRFLAPSIDGPYTHPCTKIMSSHNNSDPSKFDAKEWLASPWTPDGKTVYALTHMEFRANDYQSGCNSTATCWYNSITSAFSTNSGATFTHSPAPSNLVAAPPYQFVFNKGPDGYFTPSNIIRSGDGYFYVMFRAQPEGVQQLGTCIMRTRDISDPASWRAWNGSTFSVQFVNPYVVTTNQADHVCAPVDFNSIGTISESLTYNTYFKKYMLVGNSIGDVAHGRPPGVYYSLSDDLLNWSNAELLMAAEITFSRDCNLPDPIKESSLLDANSTSRNFETVGQTATQFYTWYHLDGCNGTLDRDLIRIPIQFSNQQPGGPSAQMTTVDRTPTVGEPVAFDATGSADANGTVEKYQWDMDGNGAFERDTGKDATTADVFSSTRQVTVTVRVTDNDGKFTDDTVVMKPQRGASARPAYCDQVNWKQKPPCRGR